VAVEVEVFIVVERAPEGTVTVAGTPKTELLDVTDTAAPPVGAGPERPIVHTLESPSATVGGAHAIEDREAGPAMTLSNEVAETPPDTAIIVATPLPKEGKVVALKVADRDPAGTITLVGIETKSAVLLNATTVPPAGAALTSVTVHVVNAPSKTDDGLQLREETSGPVFPPPLPPPPPRTEPPSGVTVSGVPVGSTPRV
jgi:hypothetical protein